jgi:hypothetical protein
MAGDVSLMTYIFTPDKFALFLLLLYIQYILLNISLLEYSL